MNWLVYQAIVSDAYKNVFSVILKDFFKLEIYLFNSL